MSQQPSDSQAAAQHVDVARSDSPEEPAGTPVLGAGTSRWFWVTWPLVSGASIVMTKHWPALEMAWLPLLAGAAWLAARRRRMLVRRLVSWLIVGAFAAVVITVFVPTVVVDEAGRAAVPFGWPLSWLTQDLSGFDHPYPYPMAAQGVDRTAGIPQVAVVPLLTNVLLYAATTAAIHTTALTWLRTRRGGRRPKGASKG